MSGGESEATKQFVVVDSNSTCAGGADVGLMMSLIDGVRRRMMQLRDNDSDGKGSDDDEGGDPMNPVSLVLGNSLIMEVAAKYLPVQSLASLRSISKSWYDAFTPQLRKLHKPIRFSALEDLTKFISTISASQVLPFSKYLLYCLPLQAEPVQELFAKFGHTMQSLNVTLEYDVGPKAGLYLTRKLITSHCHNLTEFEFFQFDTPPTGRAGAAVEWWMAAPLAQDTVDFVWNEQLDYGNGKTLPKLKKLHYSGGGAVSVAFLSDLILNLAPNLQHFDISGICSGDSATMQALNILSHKTINLSQLAVLELPNLTQEALQLLISMNIRSKRAHRLSLVELYIFGSIPSDLSLCLETFLALQAETLRSLNFQVKSYIQPLEFYLQLPLLQNLEKLTLDVQYQQLRREQNPWSFFETINNKCPRLNHLNFCSYASSEGESKWIGMNKCLSPHPHANLRVLNLTDVIIDLEQLTTLARTFPNLVQAGIALGHTWLLGSLWSAWPHLRWLELKVMWNIEDDSRQPAQLDGWITGIPTWSCKLLKWFLEHRVPPLAAALRLVKTRPGISDLKNLCSLKLHLPMNITDISIYYGLVPMNRKFRTLEINMTRLISPVAAKVLAEMLD